MKITELTYAQLADILDAASEITRLDQGTVVASVLEHPQHGDCIAIHNASNGMGLLIEGCTPGASTHDLMRAVPALLG